MYCPGVDRMPAIPLSFRELGLRHSVSATGFPFAVDAEWVNIVPRSFEGYVITRRELLHVQPGQPPGYELSFPTPPGMSGAPLLAQLGDGSWACNGWIIQQVRLGGEGPDGMIVGLAVCATILLALRSPRLGPLAHKFHREVVPVRPATPPQRPGGIDQVQIEVAEWPAAADENEGDEEQTARTSG
jgi:hypothetical protein